MVDNFFFRWRLEANAKKSGIMIVKGDSSELETDVNTYTIGGEIVPIVSQYKYLGVMFNEDWTWRHHLEYVCDKVVTLVSALEFRFWRNRAVDVKTKVIAWKTIFRPIIEYGAEVWWPAQSELNRLEVIQKRICKWILGCCRTTIDEIVLGELGVPTLQSRLLRARLAWAGVAKCIGEDRVVGLCRDLTAKRRTKAHTWKSKIIEGLREIGLLVVYKDLVVMDQVKEWKALVRVGARRWEEKNWALNLAVKEKATVYVSLKQKSGLEKYLERGEFESGGKLRFRMRSGSILLNLERKRRTPNSRFEDSLCETCPNMASESVEHFLLRCPAYDTIRHEFTQKLKDLCEKEDILSIYEAWISSNVDMRMSVVLGDCVRSVCHKPGSKRDSEGLSRKLRCLSNNFISLMWDARKRKIYQGLVFSTSGAQKPRSGSAP